MPTQFCLWDTLVLPAKTGRQTLRCNGEAPNAIRPLPPRRISVFTHVERDTLFVTWTFFPLILEKVPSGHQTQEGTLRLLRSLKSHGLPRLLKAVHSRDNAFMRVRRIIPFLIVAFYLSAGQDPRSVDLTLSPLVSTPAEFIEKKIPPTGCTEIANGGSADGLVQAEDGQPRDIIVEVVKIKNSEAISGSELEAQVRLQNSGKHPIRIPWSTDPATIDNPRDPEHLEWETATFEFVLTNADEEEISLKSLTGWLYGSKFKEGTELTLQPRDSITASVRLKLEDRAPIEPGPLKAGDWQLTAEWVQIGKSWQVRDCRAWNRNFLYQEFYRQKTPPVAIHVVAAPLPSDGKPVK